MKDSLKTFFLSAIPFGITMGLFVSATNGTYIGIISGIVMGILFGLGLSLFMLIQKSKFKKYKTSMSVEKEIIYEGAANHFVGIESVGGWLYLSENELTFKSHLLNIQSHVLTIDLDDIIEVKAGLTFGIVPNGLHIILSNNVVEKFVVYNQKTWINKIKNLKVSGLDSAERPEDEQNFT